MYYNHGLAKAKLKDYKKARIDLNKVIGFDSKKHRAYYERRSVKKLLKNTKKR